LLGRKYLVRIFNGIFHLRGIDEMKLGAEHYSYMELVAKGLELKGVKEWYLGLHSALKLNNMTHESFGIDEIMSASVFRAKPVRIDGHGFRFHKVSKRLLGFGIVKEGGIMYSDREKTILDFMYLWRYRGMDEETILAGVSEWAKGTNKDVMRRYAKRYPKAVAEMVERGLSGHKSGK
ncbi:MAG: hypothetical protein KGH66_03235, partial [Candidatus Micrarchaeota archaeon]|nr:hypothetical protein [Candidatus Micrarchaeota archaeon]